MIIVALALLAAVSGGAWRLAPPYTPPPGSDRFPARAGARTMAANDPGEPLRPQPPAPQPPARAGSDAERRWDGAPPPEPDPRADTEGAALPA